METDIYRLLFFFGCDVVRKKLLLAFVFFLSFGIVFCDYIMPSNVSGNLTSTFGECRNSIDLTYNRFHMGIDISTNAMENTKVYSMGDGYLWKVYVNDPVYGNTVLINHPDGLTTLYAHLNKFSERFLPVINSALVEFGEECHIEMEFSDKDFPVKKGENIALSGKTGATTVPHCHIEFRDYEKKVVLNPLNFLKTNINSPDTEISIEKIRVDGEQFNIVNGGTYYFNGSIPQVEIKARLVSKSGSGKFGIKSLKLYFSDVEVYSIEFTEIPLDFEAEGDYVFGEASNQSNYWYKFYSPIQKNPITVNKIREMDRLPDSTDVKLVLKDDWGNVKEWSFRLKRR